MRPRPRPRKQTPKRRKNSVVEFCRPPPQRRNGVCAGSPCSRLRSLPSKAPVAVKRVARDGSALLLELFDSGLPPRRCRGSLRRPAFAALPGSNREAPRFDAFRRTPRPGRAGDAAVPLLRCLTIRWLALIGRWRGPLPRAQCGRTPLLNGPRIASDRGKIGSHGRSFARAGSIMLPQECGAGRLDLARTAVARVTGVGENLRRRLARVEVRLGPRRCVRRPYGSRDHDPRHDASNPRHDHSPLSPIRTQPFACDFWPKKDATRNYPGQALISQVLRGKRVAAIRRLGFNSCQGLAIGQSLDAAPARRPWRRGRRR
jgi:hypothetical protein